MQSIILLWLTFLSSVEYSIKFLSDFSPNSGWKQSPTGWKPELYTGYQESWLLSCWSLTSSGSFEGNTWYFWIIFGRWWQHTKCVWSPFHSIYLLLGSGYPQDYTSQPSPLAFKWWVICLPRKHRRSDVCHFQSNYNIRLLHSHFTGLMQMHSDLRNYMVKPPRPWFPICRKASCSQQCPCWTLQVWELKFYSVI